MSKEIWVPITEVKAKIDEYGNLKTWTEIIMRPKTISKKVGYDDKRQNN